LARHGGARLRARARIAHQTLRDQAAQPAADAARRRPRPEFAGDGGGDHAPDVGVVDRQAAGQQLPRQHAERVQVGPRIDVAAIEQFGGGVGRLDEAVQFARRAARPGERHGTRDAEVEHLHVQRAAARGDHDVARRQIAVHQPGGVDRRQRAGGLLQHRDGVRRRQRPVAEQFVERATLDEFHGEVGSAVLGLADVEQAGAALVGHGRRAPRFRHQGAPVVGAVGEA